MHDQVFLSEDEHSSHHDNRLHNIEAFAMGASTDGAER